MNLHDVHHCSRFRSIVDTETGSVVQNFIRLCFQHNHTSAQGHTHIHIDQGRKRKDKENVNIV